MTTLATFSGVVFGFLPATITAHLENTTPVTATLTGAPGVLPTGGTLTGGTCTASTFSGCGFLDPILEPQLDQIAGIPQAVTVTLGTPATVSTTG